MRSLQGLSERGIHLLNEELTRLFYSKVVRPGDQVLDIGANSGEHASTLCGLVGSAGTVHAFEPNSDHYASLAGCGPNLRLWPFALGGALALRTLHIPEGLDGWASLTDIRELLPGRSFVVRTVVEVPLDALTELAELSVSFIKLDAERHEARVLAGAKTFLSRHRPPVVFESPTPEIERLFHELDYRLVTFSGATWLAVEPCLPNVIAVPASRSDRLEDWLPTGAEIAALVGNAKLRFP